MKEGLYPYRDFSVWVLTPGFPVKLQRQYGIGFNELGAGFYCHPGEIPLYLVVFNELELVEENYPLLLYSTGNKRKDFIKEILRNQERYSYYISVGFMLYIDEIREVAYMEKIEVSDISRNIRELILEMGEEGIREFIEDAGIEVVIGLIGAEKVIELLGAEKVIELMGAEKVIELLGIGKVVSIVGIEKVVEMVGLKRNLEVLVAKFGQEEVKRFLKEKK
jgi:hypothetical protein